MHAAGPQVVSTPGARDRITRCSANINALEPAASRYTRRHYVWVLVALLFLFVSYDFLGCLLNVAWTYAWWTLVPDVHYSLPAPAVGKAVVPNIIHQTWKTAEVPEKWAAAQRSCRDMHPDYEYRLWTDEESVAFIKVTLTRDYRIILAADTVSSLNHSCSLATYVLTPHLFLECDGAVMFEGTVTY